MKAFNTEQYKKELDSIGIKYTIDSNPSPKKIEKIKKILEERNFKLTQLVTDYHNSEKLKI